MPPPTTATPRAPSPPCPECGRDPASIELARPRPLSPAALVPWLILAAAAIWLLAPTTWKSGTTRYETSADLWPHTPLAERGGVSRAELQALSSHADLSNALAADLLGYSSGPPHRGSPRHLDVRMAGPAGWRTTSRRVGWPLVWLNDTRSAPAAGPAAPPAAAPSSPDPDRPVYISRQVHFAGATSSSNDGQFSSITSIGWSSMAPWVLLALLAVHLARKVGYPTRGPRVCAAVIAAAFVLSSVLSIRPSWTFSPANAGNPGATVPGIAVADLAALSTLPHGDRPLALAILAALPPEPDPNPDAILVVSLTSAETLHIRSHTLAGRPWSLASIDRTHRTDRVPEPASNRLLAIRPPPPAGPPIPYPALPARLHLSSSTELTLHLPTAAGAPYTRSLTLRLSLLCLYAIALYACFALPRALIRRLRHRTAHRRLNRGLCPACAYPQPVPSPAAP